MRLLFRNILNFIGLSVNNVGYILFFYKKYIYYFLYDYKFIEKKKWKRKEREGVKVLIVYKKRQEMKNHSMGPKNQKGKPKTGERIRKLIYGPIIIRRCESPTSTFHATSQSADVTSVLPYWVPHILRDSQIQQKKVIMWVPPQ